MKDQESVADDLLKLLMCTDKFCCIRCNTLAFTELWLYEINVNYNITHFCFKLLTRCNPNTSFGDVDLGQNWLRYWHVAWRYQIITRTNLHLSAASRDIQLRAISREAPINLICNGDYTFRITATFPRGQWVNQSIICLLDVRKFTVCWNCVCITLELFQYKLFLMSL